MPDFIIDTAFSNGFIQRFSLASCLVAGALSFASALGQAQTGRPQITGISHMCVYSSDAAASGNFYTHSLGATRGSDPQNPAGVRYYLSPTQFVEVLPLPAKQGLSRMNCVAFRTTDAAALKDYLHSKGIESLGDVKKTSDGSRWFDVKDPEGNLVEFYQDGQSTVLASATPIGTHIIHVGYLVHNKAVEDRFFQEVLGFRPYWYGAMQADHVDWISQQVPDGHDWLEYMMVGEGSDVPADHVDAHELGVLNHFSIGVANMETAVTTLIGGDRLSPRHDGPQMGKDGKWQANLYDPDGTRVELMEFQPAVKPCCSDFTAESPVN